MDSSSLSFILFQAVSPKQWTTWVYLFNLFRAVSPKQWTARVYLLSYFKRSVLNDGQLESIFSNCFERSVLNNEQFEFTFVMFQVVSPKQWTAWVYLLSHSKRSVLNNGQLEFTPALSKNEMSLKFLSQKSFPVCRITKCQKCHPQCVWSRDFTNQNVCFYKPSVYKYISNFPIQLSTR